MLHAERGGEEQIADELRAYNPLLPQGNELGTNQGHETKFISSTRCIALSFLFQRKVTLMTPYLLSGYIYA